MKRKNRARICAGNLLIATTVMLIRLMTAARGSGGTDSIAKRKMREKKKRIKDKYENCTQIQTWNGF